jgi:lysyl-tRNA synthetase, class II
MPTIDELKKVRMDKLERLKKLKVDAYPADVKRDHPIEQAREMDGKSVSVAGRIMGIRGHGKIVFTDLVDESGKIQVVLKSDDVSKEALALVDLLDIGDFIAIQGTVGKTKAGEVSIFAKNVQMLSKSIRPLPDQWHGLKDVEDRFRQRYVDLLVNPEVRNVFKIRTQIITYLRNYLDQNGFLEVETPVFQPIYGGASAKPFVTHHNALDCDLFLRISDELYLKRLVVGGFEKVYELSKDFRNEGIDHQHNPEFTMLEFYWAYANYEKLMTFTEEMVAALVTTVKGKPIVTFGDTKLDFTPPWPRKTYRDVVKEFSGIDINAADNEEKLITAIKEKNIKLDLTGVVGYGAILDTLFKATARPHLTGPMFLTDRPTAFVTLAKRRPDDPRKTASFQLLVAGKEMINAYNELNDPADQAARWRESEKLGDKGQDEHEAFDADYIRALEYGMPPTAGWGMGIDRLVSVLTDQESLKEVILFPTLRPEYSPMPTKAKPKKVENVGDTLEIMRKINKDQAVELLHAHTQNINLRRHCYAVGAVMHALAIKLGADPNVWEVLGILHDADWEETKDKPQQHTLKTLGWLKELGLTDGPLIHAFQSHNRRHTNLAELEGVMEWALETCDELTGFIVAVTLVRPEKKLESVTVESIVKKWGADGFAKAVDRKQIEQCEEKLGIPLGEFIAISLIAMQNRHEELGL